MEEGSTLLVQIWRFSQSKSGIRQRLRTTGGPLPVPLLRVPGDGMGMDSEDKGMRCREKNQCCQGHTREGEGVRCLVLLVTSEDHTH